MSAKINSFSVSFILKKAKETNGHAPLYCKISLDGKRTETSLKRKVAIKLWNGKRISGNSPEAREVNRFLEMLHHKGHQVYESLIIADKPISAEITKNKVFNIEDEQGPRTLLDLSTYHFATEKMYWSGAT